MTTYHHIARYKPSEGSGGVERFSSYLKQAVPEMELLSFEDYPDRNIIGDQLPDYDLAANMNAWLLDTGALGKDSVVVVDGYWGLGLQGKVKRLISVCHGSYWGRFVQSQISSWGEIVGYDHVDAQTEMWESSHVEVVAVCQESKREVLDSCNPSHDPVVIYHSVDWDILKPMDYSGRKVWMHASVSNRKGYDIVNALIVDHNIRAELMGSCPTLESKAKRLSEAVVLIAPTRHEGNAYVLLEAMACGVPVITYLTGLAHEFDDRCGIVTDDISPANFARLIRGFRPENHDPRAWMMEYGGPANFRTNWRNFLGVY